MGKDDDDDKVTISRKELEELRGRGMSKEEKHLRSIIRDEVGSILKDVFKFEDTDEDDDDEGEGGGIGAGLRRLAGL